MTERHDETPDQPANPYAEQPDGADRPRPRVTGAPSSRREARTGGRPPTPSGAQPPARPAATPPASDPPNDPPMAAPTPDRSERDRMDAELAAQRAALERAMRPRGQRARASGARQAPDDATRPLSPVISPVIRPVTGPVTGPVPSSLPVADAASSPASSPVTGPIRSRKDSRPRKPERRARSRVRLGPALATVAVLLIGFALVVLGGLRATTLAPRPTLDATLNNGSRVPVMSTAIGLLGLEGPRTRVTAQAASSSQTVFIGIGRASDVDAYLGDAARQELVGRNSRGQLLTRLAGSSPTITDPASSDVWVVRVRAKSAATVAWPQTDGQWRMVIASDGSGPAPATVKVTWTGRPTDTAAPVLIAVGVVLMVGGGVTLVMLASRSGLGSDDDEPDAAPPGPSAGARPGGPARKYSASSAPRRPAAKV